MNAQQIVVGFYLALEAAGAKNLVERTRIAARAAGAEFSNADVTLWLKKFRQKSDGNRTGFGRGIKHESDGKRTGFGLTRAAKVSLIKTSESVLTNPLTSPDSALESVPKESRRTPKSVAARSPVLPLMADQYAARDAIIGAVFAQYVTHRPQTRKTWFRSVNSRAAAALAADGRTPEQVVDAWRAECTRRGEPIYSLALVRTAIETHGLARTRSFELKPSGQTVVNPTRDYELEYLRSQGLEA